MIPVLGGPLPGSGAESEVLLYPAPISTCIKMQVALNGSLLEAASTIGRL